MTRDISQYSTEEFMKKLEYHKQQLSFTASVVQQPRAFLLGGQSGAGKTRLHKLCAEMLDGNVIIINGDEYRKSHPHFNEIQDRYGMDAPAHTAKWSGAMTEALIDAFSMQRYNLVIEGTLRTSDVPLKTAALLRGRGYIVSLAIMAVKPEISLVSCQIRYEMMRIAGTTHRATDPKHHDKIVHDIADNLKVLEESGAFESVLVYDRAATRLYPRGEGCQTATEVLRDSLFGPWSAEEELHYEHLKQELTKLQAEPSDESLAQRK